MTVISFLPASVVYAIVSPPISESIPATRPPSRYNLPAMATQLATAKPKRKPRAKRQDTPQPCPDPIAASLQQLQQLKLPSGDGDRMESDWHVVSITLLDELVRNHLGEPKTTSAAAICSSTTASNKPKRLRSMWKPKPQAQAALQGSRLFPCAGCGRNQAARQLGGVGRGRSVSRLGGGVYFHFHAREGCGQECGVLRGCVSCA
jgi:hypothetical protein